jgi:hypothetical protein
MAAQPEPDADRRPNPSVRARSEPSASAAPAWARSAVGVAALASIGAGAVHAAAAAYLGQDSGLYLAFFVLAAAGQVVWGLAVATVPARWLLALGALGNALVALTWVVSRTAGLPVGPETGVALPVGFPDALTVFLEVVAVACAVAAASAATGSRALRPGRGQLPAILTAGLPIAVLATLAVLTQLDVITFLPSSS